MPNFKPSAPSIPATKAFLTLVHLFHISRSLLTKSKIPPGPFWAAEHNQTPNQDTARQPNQAEPKPTQSVALPSKRVAPPSSTLTFAMAGVRLINRPNQYRKIPAQCIIFPSAFSSNHPEYNRRRNSEGAILQNID